MLEGVRWEKRKAEVGAGQNTIKKEQRVKGTDLGMGMERGHICVHVHHIMKA